jgi:hypothetical protein
VTTGKGGQIDIVRDPNKTQLPEFRDRKMVFQKRPRKDGEMGAFYTSSNDKNLAWDLVAGLVPGVSIMSALLSGVQHDIEGTFRDADICPPILPDLGVLQLN